MFLAQAAVDPSPVASKEFIEDLVEGADELLALRRCEAPCRLAGQLALSVAPLSRKGHKRVC